MDASHHILRSTHRQEPVSVSVMRSRAITRIAMTRLILVATVLLMSVTLPQETKAQSEQAAGLVDVDRVHDGSHRAPPPVAIQIGAIGVNSPVEPQKII